MRQYFISFLLTSLLLPCFGEDEVHVSSIKYIIGDQRGIWKEASPPETIEKALISVPTLLSFTALKPGTNISRKRLDKEILYTKKRLDESGFFYTVAVYAIPSKEDSNSCTVVIKVRSGMLYRYMGGALFASFGRLALGGRRNALFIQGGYNKASVSYLDENLSDKPIIALALVEYENSALEDGFIRGDHTFSIAVGGGFRVHPDLAFFTSLSQNILLYLKETDRRDTQWWTALRPGLTWDFRAEKFISGRSYNGLNIYFPYDQKEDPGLETLAFHIDSDTTLALNLDPLCLRQTARISWALDPIPSGERIDPESRVRIPLEYDEERSHTWVCARSEGAFRVYKNRFKGIFDFQTDIILFHDLALQMPTGVYPKQVHLAPGFGAGLRLKFDMPVFITVDLSFAWDYEGKTRLYFSVTGDQ